MLLLVHQKKEDMLYQCSRSRIDGVSQTKVEVGYDTINQSLLMSLYFGMEVEKGRRKEVGR